MFSTDAFDPDQRFEAWRSEFGALHDVEIEAERRRGFSARGAHWLLGPILIGVYATPARRVVRLAWRCARDDVDH